MSKSDILATVGALALGLGSSPSVALACSIPGAVATDRELVSASDAIVRARAERYVEAPCAPDAKCVDTRGKIRFRVLEVLKGPYASASFHAWGRLDDQLNEVGSCFTTAYKPDTEFLLFLENAAGIWVVLPAPLAATNREVRGQDDPRVVAVRALVKGMAQMQRKAPK